MRSSSPTRLSSVGLCSSPSGSQDRGLSTSGVVVVRLWQPFVSHRISPCFDSSVLDIVWTVAYFVGGERCSGIHYIMHRLETRVWESASRSCMCFAVSHLTLCLALHALSCVSQLIALCTGFLLLRSSSSSSSIESRSCGLSPFPLHWASKCDGGESSPPPNQHAECHWMTPCATPSAS